MADRSTALTTVRGGINRQRTKGGAPEDQLYDLLNGYVTKSKTVIVRPGTFRVADLSTAETSGRSFIAGQVASPNFPGITVTGYMTDSDGYWGTGPVGSVDADASFQGFPITGIYTLAVNGTIFIQFGRNSNGDLPNDGVNFDTSALFEIADIVNSAFADHTAEGTFGANELYYQFFDLGGPTLVDAGEYVFLFDPEDEAGTTGNIPGITKGLTAFDGTLHVYAHEEVEVPDGFTLHIAVHPTEPTLPIFEVNFAKPFMGFIFASITFEESSSAVSAGDTYLYWFQTGDTWEADHVYKLGDIVAPSTPNGLAFQAQRLTNPNIAWAPNLTRAIGDVVEPTVYNDFLYTVVDTQGANPRSGETEPAWPTEDGAQIVEDADGAAPTGSDPTVMPDPNAQPAPATSDRYDNGLGS